MYTPRAFAETDLTGLDRLIERDAFVTLVTVADGLPFASHLPVLYARDGDRIVIEGHWARPNPQARHAGPAMVIVHGPHAYLSPGWYADKE
ncbi:MAG: FMN-binding negative transcriptional regulator, partial [Pseudoxanthomonas sp.]|nr:FMN-binding negative transcriptional regulator [Pseudoxanthomonas sp.]